MGNILNATKRLLTGLLAGLVGAAVVFSIFSYFHLAPSLSLSGLFSANDLTEGVSKEERRNIALFESASPAVVYITSLSVQRDIFSMNVFEIPQGTGSGFIWDSNGYIVTNFHVIKEAEAAKVTLADQSTWDAKLIGFEPDKDIAVLQISAPAEKLQPLSIGSSKSLRVGQKVFAIGNPFGFDHTLTTGIISGLGREIKSVTDRPIQGVIQTDAAINPGNSGGPLLDNSGKLIGMNTAIVSPSGAYSGIGFAVPVDTVSRIVPQLIRFGKVSKPGMGIRVVESPVLRMRGISGAVIADVLPGSPSDKAGIVPLRQESDGSIKLGDIIVGLDGEPIEDGDSMLRVLDNKSSGDTIELEVERDGVRRKVSLKLEPLN